MLLLAIETSTRNGSVALSDGSAILSERSFAHGLQNAARLLPLIDELCREQGVGPRQITDIAISVGPGSFTGLRIGVTLAKTLAFSIGAKLLAVPTLPAVAFNAPADIPYVMCILDAKRDQVFAAVYHRQGHSLDELEPAQLTGLTDLLSRAPKPLLVLGEGVRYHAQHLFNQAQPQETANPAPFEERALRIENLKVAPESLWYPKASTIAHLGLRLKEQGAYADVFKLTPLYIRKPEAQERMEAGLLKHLE